MEKLGIACKHYCRSADNADTHHTLTINNGYVEFRAMIYGGHPGRYWSGLLEEAHFLAVGHFNSLGCSVIFKLTLIKSTHFCAVIHENNYSQRLHKWMDNLASAKTFIDTKGRMPNKRAGDAEERRRGQWIATFKQKEGGTNSKHEQLMRREIPLAFA
jgi:hypothetical protein